MFKKIHIIFILVSLCFLLYANSLNNDFVSDDIPGILKNPTISRPFLFWLDPASLLNSFNYLIAGYKPFIYHLTSIILHSLNTILVFFFLYLFFKTEAAFLGAVLFAVHPIHTEAVTWVSGKPYLIVALFIFGVYLLYQYATTSHKFKVLPYTLSLVIFSYYIVNNFSFYFVFPFLLVLSDVTLRKWRKNLKLWLPFFGIMILRLVLARGLIVERISQVAKYIGDGKVWTNPLFNMSYSLFSNLCLLFWPAKLTLYHEPPVISLFALRLEIICLVLVAFTLPFIFKKAKEIFFALGIFGLFLVPTYSPLTISSLVAERYLYFPSVSLSIVLAFFCERYVNSGPPVLRKYWLALLVFIIAGYAVRTVARNEDWKTPERFWRETVKVSYNSPRAHNNMGDIYSQEGNLEAAIREFKRAVELKSNYADGYHNLATTYYRKSDVQEAIKFFQQAILFNPQLFESHYDLGVIYLNNGELNLAQEHFKKALDIRPQDTGARSALDFVRKKKAAK